MLKNNKNIFFKDKAKAFEKEVNRQKELYDAINDTLLKHHITISEMISIFPDFLAAAISQVTPANKNEILDAINKLIIGIIKIEDDKLNENLSEGIKHDKI